MRGPTRGGKMAILVITGTILLDFVGFSILIPVLPLYAQKLGATETEIGLMLALYGLSLVLFLPLWGWISDRVGRRPVMLICLFGTAISFVALALSETLTEVYLSRAFGGFFGASIGVAQAYMTDVTPREDRAHGMGLVFAAFAVGFALGNLLGGTLANIKATLPFYAIAGFALLNLVLAALYLPESRSPQPDTRGFQTLIRVVIPTPFLIMIGVHNNRTRIYLYLFFHIFVGFSAIEAMFPLYTLDRFGWGEWETGMFLAYVGIFLGFAGGGLVGRLSKIVGEIPLLILGLVLTGGSLASLYFVHSLVPLLFAGLGVALGSGLGFPALMSLFSMVASDDEAGEFMSQSQAMVHTGRAVGPLLWGWVMKHYSAGAPFLFAGIAILGALGIFLAFRSLLAGPSRETTEGLGS